MSNIAKAAVGALAMNGGGENSDPGGQSKPLVDTNGNTGIVPDCPIPSLTHFHDQDVCVTRPVRLNKGDIQRKSLYEGLRDSGVGASLVPNQQTVVCPLQVQSLESPTAVKGLDTTWIVENSGSRSVVVAWVIDGVEWSPYNPDVKAVDDPKARVRPGEWLNVPTFDSFVYHAREIEDDGIAGQVVLQHRVGLIPIGNPSNLGCDLSKPDVEPVDPETAVRIQDYSRKPTPAKRPCNVVDVGFRNQAGCPLHVYWASGMGDVPSSGFNCGEKFRFHLGTKPATQDFMQDWESATKFEGSFIGHTFVARLASDPNVVVDSYTIETTKIIDCPNLKQKVQSNSKEQAEAIVEAQGLVTPSLEEQVISDATRAAVGDTGAGSY
jgi:hypothetical protein